jgi:glycosyltransferase involved in cell wall biosynthesis
MLDWANNARLKPEWPETKSAVRRVPVTMPRGYAGTLEPFFRPVIRWMIERERARLRAMAGVEPYVICPYPFLAPGVRHVPGSHLIYYNLDDYALYNMKRASRTQRLEDEIIRHAGLSICLSRHQVEALRMRLPDCAEKIRHFPLGVVEAFVNSDPGKTPSGKTVGYIGNMTDRVDWKLIRQVAGLMPDCSFHFVGSIADAPAGPGLGGDARWREHRATALAMPNVTNEGPVPQSDVPSHYWKYAVNWMPYDARHPFNVASCPTKIMDALASGRPFLSTDIPEARLYPNRVHVASGPEETASKLRELIEAPHDAPDQVAYSLAHTWPNRARQLLELLQ